LSNERLITRLSDMSDVNKMYHPIKAQFDQNLVNHQRKNQYD